VTGPAPKRAKAADTAPADPPATRPPPTEPLPGYLLERFSAWRALKFEPNKIWHARLAQDGQRPRAMVISCCDSRVDTVQMFGAEPGDLFVLRNIANLVPPYVPDHSHHGTSAAVEYAVLALKVAHIVVVGHSNCGGVAACEAMCAGDGADLESGAGFVSRWMEILRPGWERVQRDQPHPDDRAAALEQEAVLTSLRNLAGFPYVAEALAAKRLSLHGCWVDIGAGTLHVYDPGLGTFESAGAPAH